MLSKKIAFAQVIVDAKSPIGNIQEFFKDVPRKGSLTDAFAKTRLAGTSNEKDVVCWDLDGTRVLLFLPEGTHSIQVHVENYLDNGSIVKLKKSAEAAWRILDNNCKVKKAKLKSSYIGIYAENELLQNGNRIAFGSFIRKQFTEKILSTFLVSAAVGIAGFIAGNTSVGFFTFAATMVALATRTVLEAFHYKGEFEYEDA